MLRTAYRGFASTITLVAALLTLSATSVAASDNKKPLSVSVSAKAQAAQAARVRATSAMANVPLAFTALGNNHFSVSDADAGANPLKVARGADCSGCNGSRALRKSSGGSA